jgi:hypothetical protein
VKCRHCTADTRLRLVDLGAAPPSNAYLTRDALDAPEICLPLRVLVCERCWLAQTEDFVAPAELFSSEYAYFSGMSKSWLEHCERFVADVADRFELDESSFVVEVAANDGSLLQYVRNRGIPCLGVEPTASTAAAARERGIDVVEDFFGTRLAKSIRTSARPADLTFANNVLAHVPDINDFVAGFSTLLADHGVATFEFPHLLNLIALNQFDTIYHEHYSYLSLTAVAEIFRVNGLEVFDVEEQPTHGGSLRVFAQRLGVGQRRIDGRVVNLLDREARAGVRTAQYYAGYQARVDRVRDDFLTFLNEARTAGKKVAAYGAAAKGNTLMNYAGVGVELIEFVVDRSPAKQGKFMPGSHLPIVPEIRLGEIRPDWIVILPWNIRAEVMQQLEYTRAWGAKFVTAVPELTIVP